MTKSRKRRSLLILFIWLIILSGLALMGYPLASDYYAAYSQNRLMAEMENPDVITRPGQPENEEPRPEAGEETKEFQGAILEIPKLNLSVAVLKGTSQVELAKGPGWYEESALPGEGNTAIAGHRTMHGAWFRHVDQLAAGDYIYLKHGSKTYHYQVERVFPVASNDWSVIDPTPYPVLTLTTCHPVGSAAQRLVVRAALVPPLFKSPPH